MSDYEKKSEVTYPFYFINWQSIHNSNCMHKIKKILMRKVFPVIALKEKGITIKSVRHNLFGSLGKYAWP